MKKNQYLLIVALIVPILIGACGTADNSNKSANISGNKTVVNANTSIAVNSATAANSTSSAVEPAGPEVNSNLSVANFNKLEKGMNYAEVAKILGSEGKIISNGEFGGVKTTMYEWKGDSGAFAKVVFQNDKLYDKAHTGLR